MYFMVPHGLSSTTRASVYPSGFPAANGHWDLDRSLETGTSEASAPWPEGSVDEWLVAATEGHGNGE